MVTTTNKKGPHNTFTFTYIVRVFNMLSPMVVRAIKMSSPRVIRVITKS